MCRSPSVFSAPSEKISIEPVSSWSFSSPFVSNLTCFVVAGLLLHRTHRSSAWTCFLSDCEQSHTIFVLNRSFSLTPLPYTDPLTLPPFFYSTASDSSIKMYISYLEEHSLLDNFPNFILEDLGEMGLFIKHEAVAAVEAAVMKMIDSNHSEEAANAALRGSKRRG